MTEPLLVVAPMESLTGMPFRRVHAHFFGSVDRYYLPFVTPTTLPRFTDRQMRELAPEVNAGIHAVPQLLTRRPADFIWAAKALADLEVLAKDTRTLRGAEAKYLVAQHWYEAGDYAAAEKEVLDFIDQSTPHAYWLARSFILLADIYMATGKNLDARQYLLSLQQNYQEDDDIAGMIQQRLGKLAEVENQQPSGNE